MPQIADRNPQVDRIGWARFPTARTDTLTPQLRQHALAGVPAARDAARRAAVAA